MIRITFFSLSHLLRLSFLQDILKVGQELNQVFHQNYNVMLIMSIVQLLKKMVTRNSHASYVIHTICTHTLLRTKLQRNQEQRISQTSLAHSQMIKSAGIHSRWSSKSTTETRDRGPIGSTSHSATSPPASTQLQILMKDSSKMTHSL